MGEFKVKRLFLPMALALALASCVEPYDPPVDDRDLNLLVVDGFLNASNATASITLTRTLPVESTDAIPPESGAFVRLEDDRGTLYALFENSAPGVYSGPVSGVSFERHYRLLITTGNNSEYESEFVPVIETPAIDSITYAVLSSGVQFLVTTHDASDKAGYFRWKYSETYQYNSAFNSVFMFQGNNIVYRPPELARYTCWKTNSSTDILVGSTKGLRESIISNFPIAFIPNGSIKLSVQYSVLVEQQAITEDAFEYWSKLRKTTEQVGGLFDPLPSEVPGNLHRVGSAGETVLGFFSAGSVKELRKFLKRSSLPIEKIRAFIMHNPSCVLDTTLNADLPNLSTSAWLVDAVYASGAPGIIGYTHAAGRCVDCTLQGGATAKPDFWK
jgi:hypothetical protein